MSNFKNTCHILASVGLRRCEILNLRTSDVIVVGGNCFARVHGAHERLVPCLDQSLYNVAREAEEGGREFVFSARDTYFWRAAREEYALQCYVCVVDSLYNNDIYDYFSDFNLVLMREALDVTKLCLGVKGDRTAICMIHHL